MYIIYFPGLNVAVIESLSRDPMGEDTTAVDTLSSTTKQQDNYSTTSEGICLQHKTLNPDLKLVRTLGICALKSRHWLSISAVSSEE